MTQTWDQPELPFEEDLAPAPNEWKPNSIVGCAAIFIVGGVHPDMFTRHGNKTAVRAAVVVLNGPDAGMEIIDTLLFNTQVVRRLRQAAIGKPYTLHVDEDRQYTQPAVTLENPSEEERALGREWQIDNPGRALELGEIMVAAYNVAIEKDRENNRQMQRPSQQQAQRRTPPPTGPGATRDSLQPSSPPPSAPPSTPGQLGGAGDDEPPF
jgi:hypothetical protein